MGRPRTCILARMLPGFSYRDLVAVLINYKVDVAERRFCFACLPYNSENPLLSKEFGELVCCCESENLLVMGCDSNAHHTVWDSTNCNDRGGILNSMNLEILSQGNDPIFCSGRRLEVIDFTLGSFGLLGSVKSWEVSSEPSLLDHRYVLFTLQGSIPVRLIRNPRSINWDSFREGLRDRLEGGPEMNMKDEAGLGLEIIWVQQTLILAYEDNSLLRPVKTVRHSLKWTSELESLRKGVRLLFSKCRTDKNPQSWELYRED